MGRVTCVSISSGATLGHWTTTATVGKETFGSRSMGSRVAQMAPSSTSAAIRMVTATGRVTENRAKFMRNPLGGCMGVWLCGCHGTEHPPHPHAHTHTHPDSYGPVLDK